MLLFVVGCVPNGQAVFQGCTMVEGESCTEREDGVLFRGGDFDSGAFGLALDPAGFGVRIPRGLCSENKAYRFSCSSPTSLQQCTTKCEAGELCDAGICRPQRGCVAEQWTRVFEGEVGGRGGYNYSSPLGLDVSNDGTSIYVFGGVAGRAESDPGMFISKFDSCGNRIWSHDFHEFVFLEENPYFSMYNGDLIIDNENNYAYVVGNAYPKRNFSLTTMFIVQLNATDGSFVWSTTKPLTSGNGIALDAENNIYVTGLTRTHNCAESSILAPINGTNNGTNNGTIICNDFNMLFYAKYHPGRTDPIWFRTYIPAGVIPSIYSQNVGHDLILNSEGLYLTGRVEHVPLSWEMWLAKVEPISGEIVWSVIVDAPEVGHYYYPEKMVRNSRENFWIIGTELIDLFVGGGSHIFLRYYNASGGLLSNQILDEYGNAGGIAVSLSDDIVFTGDWESDIEVYGSVGDIIVRSSRGWDSIVDYDGYADRGKDVVIDMFGNVYVFGKVTQGESGNEYFWLRKYREDGFYR